MQHRSSLHFGMARGRARASCDRQDSKRSKQSECRSWCSLGFVESLARRRCNLPGQHKSKCLGLRLTFRACLYAGRLSTLNGLCLCQLCSSWRQSWGLLVSYLREKVSSKIWIRRKPFPVSSIICGPSKWSSNRSQYHMCTFCFELDTKVTSSRVGQFSIP